MSSNVSKTTDRTPTPSVQSEVGMTGRGQVPGPYYAVRVIGENWRRTTSFIARHWSFWTVMGTTAVLTLTYFFVFAEPLFVSETVLTIQSKSGTSAAAVTNVLAGSLFGGGATSNEDEAVAAYISSPDMLKILDKQFHLRDLYSSSKRNPFWRLWFPNDENFLYFYQDMVTVTTEDDIDLITVDVADYDPHRAQAMAKVIIDASEKFMNSLNDQMANATITYARKELNDAEAADESATMADRPVAELRLTAAQQGLVTAYGLAAQEDLFVEPITYPPYPTSAVRPQKLLDFFAVLTAVAVLYSIGALFFSNLRDHRTH